MLKIDQFHNIYFQQTNKKKKNPLEPMGALAPGSAHARPSTQASIDTSKNSVKISTWFFGPEINPISEKSEKQKCAENSEVKQVNLASDI